MSDGLFSAVELDGAERTGYRLQRLEVFNWGTFDKQAWRLTPGADTALLTGDIGSGKSTLVDALTTLLMPAHKIAYNKAAGADAKERTLRSYVEGHYKSERVESSGTSRPIGLRSDGRTYSVILGVFTNEGYGETVALAQVFQQRESTGQPYRFYVSAGKDLSVGTDFADFGTDLRDLRRRLRNSGADVFDEFPKYSASLRRLLGIASDQALELFHQTVSMKSVGNLNEFVRNHMLEPSDATERIKEIIGHFDDLTKAHDAVKRAREQLEALDPIVTTAAKYEAALADRETVDRQRGAIRLFIADLRSRLLGAEIEALELDGGRLLAEQDEAKARQQQLTDERESLIEQRARAGGDRIGELERLERAAHEEAKARREQRALFEEALAAAQFSPVVGTEDFLVFSRDLPGRRARLADAKRGVDNDYAEAIGVVKDLNRRRSVLDDELASLDQRTSNLPTEQFELRARLCADLGLDVTVLPYAGELLDVADDHAQWRGAAERVLRAFALSLLVPHEHYDAVTDWVNSRRLSFRGHEGRPMGAKLVFERVSARRVPLQRQATEQLVLADCMQVKEGPFRDYLLDELTKRADHRCATTLEQFRAERKAVTQAGQVRSGERHEKDDRHRVDDPRRWVLGWANGRKIAALRTELAELTEQVTNAEQERNQLERDREQIQARLDATVRLEAFRSFADLDADEALARAEQAATECARLKAGSSQLEQITQALERTAERAATVEQLISRLTGRLATGEAERRRAERAKQDDDQLIARCPSDELAVIRASYPALSERLGDGAPTHSSGCAAAGDLLADDLHKRIERLTRELGGYGQSLAGHMSEVLRRWPALSADLDASVEARGEFLAYHQRVASDDLPRFEAEFKRQLNTNTIRELASFNQWLRRQAEEIDDRVGRINEALGAIPYNPGRYIRLEKQPSNNQDVVAFRTDLRSATDDAISGDDDHYSEERFLDVKRMIERFRGREGYADSDKAWTRRVTDVRNWFVFSASERDLSTGEEWEHYSDSDGKSGGQKEKLAYTILAASLAYQFGLEWGAAKSRDFRFAVIDEAFGRGSDVSTRYALELFAKLGLQLLIVTPLQKVHVIEPYVRAIGYVDNPTGTFSRLQTMTIEQYRAERDGRRG